ncbi:MAG: DUF1289 domain-containing protein [Rhizobiales bacterium]|nr:DUF1289 domain-containing protein [Hyphomicrobiales bacterium]
MTNALFETMTGRSDPCVNICVKDEASDICLGCGRLGAEIAVWSELSAHEQQSIIAQVPDRMKALSDARRTRRRARIRERDREPLGGQVRPDMPEA